MPLRTADRYYASSAAVARRGAREARKASAGGAAAVALVVARHQAAQAAEATPAVTAMLAEQGIRAIPEVTLNPVAFTTSESSVEAMLAEIDRAGAELTAKLNQAERPAPTQTDVDERFDRLVESLIQDAARAAQLTTVTARPSVQHVRHLTLPSCSRCAVLAGRVYRFSDGFLRHPGCDCVMIPVTIASPDLTYDPVELARNGQIRGLSKADMDALEDGADFGQVVNVRSRKAGLMQAGQTLTRRGRMTPAGIYSRANTREEALELLTQQGYLR